jgi:hypothetical protein
MKESFCCCEGANITNWEPDSEGQECHFMAGETLMCEKCGQTLKPSHIYPEFLKSKQWKQLRFMRFIQDGFSCVDCGSDASEVHHEHYENILDIDTCVSLCHECHGKRHNKNSEKIEGYAKSVSIKKLANRHNLTKCPKCHGEFTFYESNGFWCCYNCDQAGDLYDFAKLILFMQKGKLK